MIQSVTIQPMFEFRPDAKVGASISTRWNNWQSDFEMFFTAGGITDPKRKRALLLYQVGPRMREIFKQLPETGNDDEYDVSKTKTKTTVGPSEPTSVHDVQSFLGMANYSSKYIPDFATLTAPLGELTKKNIRFQWQQPHQAAFEKLKNTLASAPCTSYFDKNKKTFFIVGASPVGISAILAQ